jgi:hypothetical protein
MDNKQSKKNTGIYMHGYNVYSQLYIVLGWIKYIRAIIYNFCQTVSFKEKRLTSLLLHFYHIMSIKHEACIEVKDYNYILKRNYMAE